MPLQSRLFRGDPALEACLVRDPAHIRLGAGGDHVGKIQRALLDLDHARIDDADLTAQQYGRSTAGAVLAYKRKRQIINRSYQTQADDIVGKMTIAALDREMVVFENRSRRPQSCGDPLGPRSGSANAAVRVSLTTPASPAVAGPPTAQRFSAQLSVMWQVTEIAAKRGASRHLVLIDKALQLLRPFGMSFFSRGRFPDEVPLANNDIVDPRFQSDTWNVRKASEKRRPGERDTLRIIVCPFDSGSPAFGVTDGGTFDGVTFPFFILINVNKLRDDNCTFLHEMIHAATGLGEADHDQDADSVFSVGSNRSVLKPEHAKALSTSFFALP